jgi:hypothetical protein
LTENFKTLAPCTRTVGRAFEMTTSLSRFLDYLSNNEKVDLSKVTVNKTDTAGNGLFASHDFDSDSESNLLTIPSKLIITAQTARDFFKENVPEVYKEINELPGKSNTERFTILAFLVYGYTNPSKFPYQAYLDILPTVTDFKKWHALFFNDEYMQLMEGSSLAGSIEARRENLKKELKIFLQLVPSFPEDVPLKLWKWADTIFWTRVISIGSRNNTTEISSDSQTDCVLVPMIDFANHSLKPNVRWEIDEHGNFQLVAKDDVQIKPGDELFLSYGDKSNQELLFTHGFCIPDNPTPAKLTLSAVSFLTYDERSYREKFLWLRKIGYNDLVLTLERESQGMWHPLLKAGWDVESVKLMHLAVLSLLEDNLVFTVNEGDDENYGDVEITFDQVDLKDMDHFFSTIKEHKDYPVHQLRTVLILSDALEFHYNTLATAIEEDEPFGDSDLTRKHIKIYAQEELELLFKALKIMEEEKAKLAENETVIEYLEQGEDTI